MNTDERNPAERAAMAISVIFHPVLMPLYGLLVIYSSPTLLSFIPFSVKKLVFIITAANMVIIPLSVATVLYSRGVIRSFNTREKGERMLLLSFTMVMYILTAFLIMRLPVPGLFKGYFVSIAAVTLVTLIITPFYRVSLHSAGAGGLLALVVVMIILFETRSVWHVALLVTGTGAVMSSRLYLRNHEQGEVWAGLLAGASSMSASLWLFIK